MGKQKTLPGMDERKIPDLHRAAEKYVEIRDERMALTVKESQAQEELMGLMKSHKKRRYAFDDIEVKIVHLEEKVKVKRIKEGDEPEEDEDQESEKDDKAEAVN